MSAIDWDKIQKILENVWQQDAGSEDALDEIQDIVYDGIRLTTVGETK